MVTMTEKTRSLQVEGLRDMIRDHVRAFAEECINALGDNLQSLTVVGSALTDDFIPGKSDINTVLVLGSQSPGALDALARIAKSMTKKRMAVPLLMTSAYIERSRDVFGIEFLDLQLIHRTILGDDPFASLTFTKSEVRLQCERELKATLIRLRQGYMAAAGNKRLIRDILASAAGGLVPLLRALLWLKDMDRPVRAGSVLVQAASQFSIKADTWIEVRKWRHEKSSLATGQWSQVFESMYGAVEQLAFMVDQLEV
jgi:hypothetical protein